MREVDFDTFFTSSKLITLDSIYFQAGSRVQCAARAVNADGLEGLELSSTIVTISVDEGERLPSSSSAIEAKCSYPEGPAGGVAVMSCIYKQSVAASDPCMNNYVIIPLRNKIIFCKLYPAVNGQNEKQRYTTG